MSTVDTKIDAAADKLQELAERASAGGGVRSKLAEPLADDAQFLRKLKPSLIKARVKGELPTDEKPEQPRVAPAVPQLEGRDTPKRKGPGPNPWLIVGAALAGGILLARWIDWRGHAHPRR
jgi:hypothetical protein